MQMWPTYAPTHASLGDLEHRLADLPTTRRESAPKTAQGSHPGKLVKRAQERMTWKAKRHAGRQANLSGHRMQATQSYVKRCQA